MIEKILQNAENSDDYKRALLVMKDDVVMSSADIQKMVPIYLKYSSIKTDVAARIAIMIDLMSSHNNAGSDVFSGLDFSSKEISAILKSRDIMNSRGECRVILVTEGFDIINDSTIHTIIRALLSRMVLDYIATARNISDFKEEISIYSSFMLGLDDTTVEDALILGMEMVMKCKQ